MGVALTSPSRLSTRCGAGVGSTSVGLALCVLVISSLPFLTSCQTQDNVVRKSASALVWYRHLYYRECVAVKEKAPEGCKQRYLQLERLREDTTAADDALKVGKLPKSAIQSIREQTASLEEK